MKTLVIGLGSIGARHSVNLMKLGHEVKAVDPKGDACFTGAPIIETVVTLADGLAWRPEAILICTPPSTHLDIGTQCLAAKVPLFIEKPLAECPVRALDFLREADRQHTPIAVGYQMRAIEARRQLWRTVTSGAIGKIYAAHAEFAFSMEKWRKAPATYQAGIIMEASHELDQLCWMLGTPYRVIAAADTDDDQERLGVGVIEFESGARATFHLDGLAPSYRRSLTIYGEAGTEQVGFEHIDNDHAYQKELGAWLDGHPYCTGKQALETVRLLDAIMRSRLTGTWVKVLG